MASTGSRGFSFFGRTRIWDNRVPAPIGPGQFSIVAPPRWSFLFGVVRRLPALVRRPHESRQSRFGYPSQTRSKIRAHSFGYAICSRFRKPTTSLLTILHSEQFSQRVWRMP